MSVEVDGHGRTLLFIRNLLTSRNASRSDSNPADVQAVAASSVVTPAHAIFQDARNTSIRNAIFNIYGSGSNMAPVCQSPLSSSPPSSSAESSSSHFGAQSPGGISIIEIDSNPSCLNTPFPAPQTSPEIYVHCLKSQNRGYPLWIPSPSMSLPASYRSSGVRVGDVGIITPEGGFSFFFNVLHGATHPINAEMLLPEHFVPYAPRRSAGVSVLKESSAMSYLADRSVTRIDGGEDKLKTVLKTSAKQAAVLMMPEPVYLSRLADVNLFRRYVHEHLESWYRFIRGELGWDVENGDLRIVYACRKTASFGIATVFNDCPDATTELTFSIDESWTEIAGCRYRWHHRGSAEVKAGPSTDENADIRELEGPNGSAPVNQCLFVNTLDFTLSDDQWTRVDADGCVPFLTDASATQRTAARSPTSHAPPRRGAETSTTNSDVQYGLPSSSVRRCESPLFKKLWHPSDTLRKFLLSKVPDAKSVGVCSEDWGPFMTEDVNDATSFIRGVLSANDVCEENGMVYLKTKASAEDNIALDGNALAEGFSEDLIEDGVSDDGPTVAGYFDIGKDSLDQSKGGSGSPESDHVKLELTIAMGPSQPVEQHIQQARHHAGIPDCSSSQPSEDMSADASAAGRRKCDPNNLEEMNNVGYGELANVHPVHSNALRTQPVRHSLVNTEEYTRLNMLGQGSSSRVIRVRNHANEVFAIKRMWFDHTEAAGAAEHMREASLRKSTHPKRGVACLVYRERKLGLGKEHVLLVVECATTDLAMMLATDSRDMNWIAYYWRQLLEATQAVHKDNLVLRDLKPADFAVVRGQLKLFDFDITSSITNHAMITQEHHDHELARFCHDILGLCVPHGSVLISWSDMDTGYPREEEFDNDSVWRPRSRTHEQHFCRHLEDTTVHDPPDYSSHSHGHLLPLMMVSRRGALVHSEPPVGTRVEHQPHSPSRRPSHSYSSVNSDTAMVRYGHSPAPTPPGHHSTPYVYSGEHIYARTINPYIPPNVLDVEAPLRDIYTSAADSGFSSPPTRTHRDQSGSASSQHSHRSRESRSSTSYIEHHSRPQAHAGDTSTQSSGFLSPPSRLYSSPL